MKRRERVGFGCAPSCPEAHLQLHDDFQYNRRLKLAPRNDDGDLLSGLSAMR
jgi:hypothetical protein